MGPRLEGSSADPCPTAWEREQDGIQEALALIHHGERVVPGEVISSKEIPMGNTDFKSTPATRALKSKSFATTERMTPTRHQAEEAISCGHSSVSPEHIAIAAYFRAERRGFAPGGDLDDWLAAERELQNGPDSEDVSGS